MSTPNDVVYLEDVEPPQKSASNDAKTNDTNPPASVKHVAPATVSVKRQLSIADMFSSQPATSKRQKADVPQKTTSDTASLDVNLDAFRASLPDEAKELLDLELETMGKSWLKVLIDEIKKPYFISLKRWLVSEGLPTALSDPSSKSSKSKIFPPAKDIYTWSQTPLGCVRVVIIGQDPYHSPGQAHGLSFSVPKGVTPPPSLKNIYTEIQMEYPDFQIPKHGNLSTWAANGVLLLNTCLTVRAHAAGSHSNKGWEQFTDRVINVIDRYAGADLSSRDTGRGSTGKGVVFLAWGSWAQKRVAKLDKKKHLILTSAHPSPLSAHKGFFGNNHFKAANIWLEKRYGKEGIVDWCQLD